MFWRGWVFNTQLSRFRSICVKSLVALRWFWKSTFQQDDNPEPSAEATAHWFKKNQLNVLEKSSQCQDRNPADLTLWPPVDKQKQSNPKELQQFEG